MYFTISSTIGSIKKAGMDGSNSVQIVTGLETPIGITIDFENSRLYWMVVEKMQSSNMQGKDIRTIIQFPTRTNTWGVAMLHGRIYSTSWTSRTFSRCTETGQDLRLLYNGTENTYGVAVIPRLNLPTNRMNDCADQNCPGVCVLSPTSSTCLPSKP